MSETNGITTREQLPQAAAPPQAEQWLRRALTLAESRFGQRSQEAARAHQRLAALLQQQQRLAEAYEHYAQALALNELLFGEEAGLVRELCHALSQLQAARGQWAEAEHYAHRAAVLRARTTNEKWQLANEKT